MCRLLLKTESTKEEMIPFSQGLNAMVNGGPDKTKVTFDPVSKILFGHNRLSIIDLSEKGDQPMEIDGNTILFNGEIYNHKYLKEKYQIETISECDTEVILRLYNMFGAKSFDMLDGEFAIVISDRSQEKIWMVRDRLGIKPLYYSQLAKNGSLILSSEIKGIFPFVKPEMNDAVFNQYLLYGYTENATMFKHIYKAIPGIRYEFDLHGNRKSTSLLKKADLPDFPRKDLNTVIKRSIEKRMMADVPVSCTLSGGIDSSIVAMVMANLSETPINTYTIGFKDCENEFDKARKVSEWIGSIHHEIEIPFEKILENIDDIIYTMEEPIDRGSLVPTYFLAKEIKEKVTLIGEGSDEIFAGYSRHKYLADNDVDFEEYFSSQLQSFPSKETLGLEIPDIKADKNLALKFDLETEIPNFHTNRIDKCMMHNGIEARVPFLDPEVVEAAMLIPYSEKQNPEKKCLREAFKGELPPVVTREPKKALKLPFDKIVKMEEVEKQIREETGYFSRTTIDDLYEQLGVKKNSGRDLWNIFLFNRWLKIFNLNPNMSQS